MVTTSEWLLGSFRNVWDSGFPVYSGFYLWRLYLRELFIRDEIGIASSHALDSHY
ncbi:hypothetical protein QNZ96_001623 [Vibrio parahaemolyticus]|nr:hypothetical protein [Vibrio parahaemolyticus]